MTGGPAIRTWCCGTRVCDQHTPDCPFRATPDNPIDYGGPATMSTPNPPELGDQPIEPAYEQVMQHLAGAIDIVFNGAARGDDRRTGFVLLVFPFGEAEGRCNYISNGADRRDVLKLLEEQAQRFREDQRA